MNELDTRAERFLESIRAEGEAACAAIREETEREVTGRLDETRRAENARVERTLRFETERARTRANRDLSAARMAARAKLADQRQKIADETFAKAKAQLADFAASDKYAAWLQTEAVALAEALGENANLSVRSIDLPLLKGVKLPAGTTVVAKEIRAPENYALDSTPQTITVQAGEVSQLVYYDKPLCNLTLLKRDAVTKKLLSKAEFIVKDSTGTPIGPNNGRYITGSDGTVTVTGLQPNSTVIVSEDKAPTGYIKDSTPKTIVVKSGVPNSLTFDNEPSSTLIIHKYIEGTENEPIAGVCFKVTDGSGAAVGPDDGVYYTDKAGEIVLNGLEPGTTVIAREIKTVDGFVLDGTPQDILIKAGEVQHLTFWNKRQGALIVNKLSSQDRKTPLEGVTFRITTATGEFVPDENGKISSNGLYFTDKDGKITIHGVVGTLVVTETATIPGYTIDEASRTQTVVVNPNDTQTLHFTNTPSTTLVIEKYIEGTTTPLKGVTFLVTDSSGAVVGRSNGEFITDENGRVVIHDLEPGTTVTAREVKTVDGFVLDSSPKSILIKAGEVQTLRFYNVRAGGLTVIKKDEKTGERIPGVQFEIRKMDGEIVGTYTTDENGVIYLPEAENGWYTVTELKAAEGYRLDDTPHRVEVRDGQTATLEITNKAISGILLHKVNAVTGEHTYYEQDVPTWVDRVYDPDIIVNQYDFHGKLVNGWINSWLGQKAVTTTTAGYNYIALNDDVYMYTGVTSAGSDESNVGFLLVNQRTKAAKYYNVTGAEEYSAMSSAEGAVQHLNYAATFPLLLNISDQPTYFMALKDSAELVKMYAMVNVSDYQITATGTTVAACQKAYQEQLAENGIQVKQDVKEEEPAGEERTVTGEVAEIRSSVISGNTWYYFRLKGKENACYYGISAADCPEAVTYNKDDQLTITYPISEDGTLRTASEIKVK
mgnify:CR=1 FL=1